MEREQRLREIAYDLWRDEGQLEGEAERHWFAAEAILAEEEAGRDRGSPGEAAAGAGEAPAVASQEI